MRILTTLAVSIYLLSVAAPALARGCPPGTSYQCTQGYGGKVICGCR